MKRSWFGTALLALAILLPWGIAHADSQWFATAEFPEETEISTGFVRNDQFLFERTTIPLRVEFNFGDRVSGFGQVSYFQEDTFDVSTFTVGGGAMFRLAKDGNRLPLDLAARIGLHHTFESEEKTVAEWDGEPWITVQIMDYTILDFALVGSKSFETSGAMRLTPFANLNTFIDVEDPDSDIPFTIGLGLRANFNESFAATAEIDFGDMDAMMIGGSYMF